MKLTNKIHTLIMVITLGTIIVFIFINSIFLYKFYLLSKKNEVDKLIEEIYINSENPDFLREIEEKYDIMIFVSHVTQNTKKLKVKNKKIIDSKYIKERIKESYIEETPYTISYIYKINSMNIKVDIAKLSIINMINVVNRFLFFIGITLFVIEMLLSYYISRIITRPILKLNDQIGKMANLDFREKIKISGNNEIAALGENINFLAQELEANIESLKVANIKLKENIKLEILENKNREEFIGALTHEVKTPITIINTYLEFLDSKGDELEKEKKQKYMNIVVDEGENLSNLLDELIKFIKSQNKIESMNFKKVEIVKLINNMQEKFEIDYLEKNIEVIFNEKNDKYHVLVDQEKIKQVIENIMSNAVSHVNENGIIKINIFEERKDIVVEIFNTGSQIEVKNIEKIWDSFFKEDESRSRKYGGIGLGLSIVKSILEKHESRYGAVNIDNGIKFWFTLKKYI